MNFINPEKVSSDDRAEVFIDFGFLNLGKEMSNEEHQAFKESLTFTIDVEFVYDPET